MTPWIIGTLIVLIVSAICWLIFEFVSAPTCDENGQCFK